MVEELTLSVLAFAVVGASVWYYTKYVESEGSRSRLKRGSMATVFVAIAVGGADFMAYMPLRVAVAIAIAFFVGHTVESINRRATRG